MIAVFGLLLWAFLVAGELTMPRIPAWHLTSFYGLGLAASATAAGYALRRAARSALRSGTV